MEYAYSNQNIITPEETKKFVLNFDTLGEVFNNFQNRNTIKVFRHNNFIINIKSFKKPNPFNKFVYRFFRKSKAKRSFEYAFRLIENGFKTPHPIAYFESQTLFTLTDSYYVSQHISFDMLFRDIHEIEDRPLQENILRQFTRFTHRLHEAGIEFLDHSAGNTLIVKNDSGDYDFYLVDLNRMRFHKKMNTELRIKNFARLTIDKNIIDIIINEYATLTGENEDYIRKTLNKYIAKDQNRRQSKKKFKKLLGIKKQ